MDSSGRMPLQHLIRFKERQWFLEEIEVSCIDNTATGSCGSTSAAAWLSYALRLCLTYWMTSRESAMGIGIGAQSGYGILKATMAVGLQCSLCCK